MGLPSKERGCDGKINLGGSYCDRAQKLANKHQKRFGVYSCPHCGGSHLSTKIENADKYSSALLCVVSPES